MVLGVGVQSIKSHVGDAERSDRMDDVQSGNRVGPSSPLVNHTVAILYGTVWYVTGNICHTKYMLFG